MSGKPEILCAGHDAVLNRTRRLILQRCFEVDLAENFVEAKSLLREQRFALVLLCYTLTDEECCAMAALIHSLPWETRILLLGQLRDGLVLQAGDEEFLTGGPAELVKKAAAMAGMGPEEVKDCLPDVPARKSA